VKRCAFYVSLSTSLYSIWSPQRKPGRATYGRAFCRHFYSASA